MWVRLAPTVKLVGHLGKLVFGLRGGMVFIDVSKSGGYLGTL